MSAVFGIWHLDGRSVQEGTLDRMSKALAHRGPDGSDAWQEGAVGLGHRMFRTTPESLTERQPIVVRAGDLVLTVDGRIDNRDELIRNLGLASRPSETVTDAELVLGAYERWGDHCAEHLLGDFAFAVWDSARRSLLCGRDHFGVKPLYYFHTPGRIFAFASEVKALFALEEVPRDFDELEIARHLMVPLADDPASTYYRHVRRVPPGHTMTVTTEGLRFRRYWSLDPGRELRLASDREYAEAVREAFVEAVRCRLRAISPVASMLSGGLDSSSVTCVADRILKETGRGPMHTVSAIYPDVAASDESRFIRAVLDQCNVEPHFFEADHVSPIAELDRMNWHGDGANFAGNLYLNWNLYQIASSQGARVVLDGFDGDTTVSHGHCALRELAGAGRWIRLAREVRGEARMGGQPWRPALWRWIRAYRVRPALRRLGLARQSRRVDNDAAPRWSQSLDADFAESLMDHVVSPVQFRTERDYHYFMLRRSILLHSLSFIDAIGAGAGVEARFPFFDVRLAELCLSLPTDQKRHRGWSRVVMRRAMEGYLPEQIQWRSGKSDMGPGFHHTLRTRGGDDIDTVLQAHSGHHLRYADLGYFRETHEKFIAGRASDEEDLKFWRILSLALWLNAEAAEHSTRRESRAIAGAGSL